MISYGCFDKRSSKPVIKNNSVETIEIAIKEYVELSEQDEKKLVFLKNFLLPKLYFNLQ